MKQKPYELQRLLPRHHKILEMCIDGFGAKEIAEVVGMTPQAISLITNAPLFQDALAKRREVVVKKIDQIRVSTVQTARERLESAAEDAANVHITALDDEDVRVQQASATAILNKVFDKADLKASGNVVLSADTINVLAVAIEESKKS